MTVFEKILAGDIPSEKVYEDDAVLAFKDIDPQAPCHVLVIPKQKAQDFDGIISWSDEEAGRFFKKAAQTARKLGLEKTGYRLVINTGADAMQSVPYLHIHLLGGKTLGWPPYAL